jgi:hypothetical protein
MFEQLSRPGSRVAIEPYDKVKKTGNYELEECGKCCRKHKAVNAAASPGGRQTSSTISQSLNKIWRANFRKPE